MPIAPKSESTYRAAIVGAGAPTAKTNANLEGFSIGYTHAQAYLAQPGVELVAVADIKRENAEALVDFAGGGQPYTSVEQLLAEQQIDILSVCTWPTLHAEMVLAAIAAGVKIILCEKPMAVSLTEIDSMLAAASGSGVRLFVNHQRRYERQYDAVRRLIDDGVLGELERLEGYVGDGWDLMSWGSHWVDMARYFANDAPVKWVFAAAAMSGNVRYGHLVEDQMLLQFGIDGGPLVLMHTGSHTSGYGIIATGSKGTVHLLPTGPTLALMSGDATAVHREYFATRGDLPDPFALAVADMIHATEKGIPCRIDAASGHVDTEIILAAFESARTNAVLQLPLQSRTASLRPSAG